MEQHFFSLFLAVFHICGLQVRFQEQDLTVNKDETAINGLKFTCCDQNTTKKEVLVENGQFGTWNNMKLCPEDYKYTCGLQLRYQPEKINDFSTDRLDLDNTGLNGLQMQCCAEGGDNQNDVVFINEGFEGVWQGLVICDKGMFVCGFDARVGQNETDLVGLNGLKMSCCE